LAGSCPHCEAQATPQQAAQQCTGCSKAFSLHAGPALDPSRQPSAPRQDKIKVKAEGLRFGVVDTHGVAEGIVDPITGFIPIDQSGVAYGDIVSVAVWRRPAWVELVAAVMVPLPITFFALYAALSSPNWLWIAMPFAFFAAFMLYRALLVQAHFARIVGRDRTITVRFDRPLRRRRRFHAELLARTGIPPAPIP
jgi:hypothetical protein